MSNKTVLVEVNGYLVSESLLEGVMFNVLFSLNEDYRVTDVLVSPKSVEDVKYLNKLGSVQKHCEAVRDWVLEEPHNTLLELGDEQGKLSDDEVDLVAMIEPHREPRPEPVRIEATNLADLLGGL